jgi:hypothetical protein
MVSSSDNDDDDSSQVLKGNTAPQHKIFVMEEGAPPGWAARWTAKARQFCGLGTSTQAPEANFNATTTNTDAATSTSIGNDKQQFRLDPNQGFNAGLYLLTCGLFGGKQRRTIGISPNQQLGMYLHWMFRVNFLFLFCVMCIMFFVWVMVFAALIMVAGTMDPMCVQVGGEPFGNADSKFADAFALSWTTFSTVVRADSVKYNVH